MNLELENDLNRFIERQKEGYNTALKEIKNGKKKSCWMWFIFPQVRGLGSSTISSFYGIKDLEEGIQYLSNKKLRKNLIEITKALLDLGEVDIREVMGFIDDIKLKSSMTFFNIVEKESGINCGGIFNKVLTQFFKGEEDENTYKILKKQKLEKENKNEINEKEKDKNNNKVKDKDEFNADTIESENIKKFIGKKTKESNVKIENEEKENIIKDKGKEVNENGDKDKEKEDKDKEEIKEMENTKKEEIEKVEKEEKEKVEKEIKEKVEKEVKEKENKEKEKVDKEDKEKEEKVGKENKNKEDKDNENKGKSLKNSENENFNIKFENKGEDDNIEDQNEKISYNEIKISLKSYKKNNSLKNEENGKDKLSLYKNKNNINEQNKNEIKKNEDGIIMKNYGEYKINGENDQYNNGAINIKLGKVENKGNKCCDINCNII